MITITFDTIEEYRAIIGVGVPEAAITGSTNPPKISRRAATERKSPISTDREETTLTDDQRSGPGCKGYYRRRIERLGLGRQAMFRDDQGVYRYPNGSEISHQLKRIKQAIYHIEKEHPSRKFEAWMSDAQVWVMRIK